MKTTQGNRGEMGIRTKEGFALIAAVFVLAAPALASVNGRLDLDTSSFLKSSGDRVTTSSAVGVALEASSRNAKLQTQITGSLRTFVEKPSAVGGEVFEAYVGTSPDWIPHHQVSLGRRKLEWSRGDRELALGLWNPRFLWDPMHPEETGMVGAFYQYRSKLWSLQVSVSPISIPDRGTATYAQNGKITGDSPLWNPLPESVSVLGNQTAPIEYNILMPSIGGLVGRPSMIARARVGLQEGWGPWLSVAGGSLPISQPSLALESRLNSARFVVEANIHPLFHSRELVTVETGFDSEEFSTYLSITREWMRFQGSDPSWFTDPMGNTWTGILGVHQSLSRYFKAGVQHLVVVEKVQNQSGATTSPGVEVPIPDRLGLSRAWRFSGEWSPTERIHWATSYLVDDAEHSGLLSSDLNYEIPKSPWRLQLGVDLVVSNSRTGFVGQFKDNDRGRMKVSYAF